VTSILFSLRYVQTRIYLCVYILPSGFTLIAVILCCSLASSTTDLAVDALQLERAIRDNDTLRVKRFLDLHHDKFQVS